LFMADRSTGRPTGQVVEDEETSVDVALVAVREAMVMEVLVAAVVAVRTEDATREEATTILMALVTVREAVVMEVLVAVRMEDATREEATTILVAATVSVMNDLDVKSVSRQDIQQIVVGIGLKKTLLLTQSLPDRPQRHMEWTPIGMLIQVPLTILQVN
jgi:hypothetical protein